MTEEKILKDGQYRKNFSIAFFNSVNAATSIVNARGKEVSLPTMVKDVLKVKDILLEEYKKYYAEVISQVGKNYDVAKTIKLLNSTKTKEELRVAWLALSEDERRDGEIRKVAKSLKSQYK